MSTLEADILDAALRAFSRYGFKRTSMTDLCKEAGVSRQTLYNHFRNKDDILNGLIAHKTDVWIDTIQDGLESKQSLKERIELVFDHMVLQGYDVVQAMPNAQDFIDQLNTMHDDAFEASNARFRSVIEDVLRPYEAAITARGMDLPTLSDFVQRSAKSAGLYAHDRAHLVAHLQTLTQLCQSAACAPEAGAQPSKDTSDA